jgi:hypothetical protein
MPWLAMKIGALVVPMWREIVAMSYLWRVPHALDGTALASALGARPVTPIDAALREMLLALGFGDAAAPGARTTSARAPAPARQ